MKTSTGRIAVLACLLPLVALAQRISLPRNLPDIKPAVGLRVNGSYQFGKSFKEGTSYGLSAEVIFPVYKYVGVRAQLLNLTLNSSGGDVLTFNTDLSFDALLSLAAQRRRVAPYLYGGLGLLGLEGGTRLELRAGAGIEGRIMRLLDVFGEAGLDYRANATTSTTLTAGLGIRARTGR